MNHVQDRNARIAAMTTEQRVQRAVRIFLDPGPILQSMRVFYLQDCGISDTEISEALNQASSGKSEVAL